MNERQGISIAVLSSDQDDVELVNRSLRDAGHIAHCRWISKPAQFDEALRGTALELIILNCDTYPDSIRQTAKQKDAFFPEVPLIALRQEVDEAGILQAMKQGACDLVSLRKMDRLQAVVSRELRAFRVERALNSTLSSATEYRRQLQAYMQGSRTAIANVQEGIVTDVNSAWLKLFRLHSPDEVVGLPLMDLFEAESQAAIKGALIATVKGKWQAEEKLLAKSQATGDDKTELQLGFGLIEMDDGQYVQIRIAPPEKAAEEPTKLVHEALKRDPTTLLFHRAQFLERLKKRLGQKPKSGLHAVAFVKPDKFSQIRKLVGEIASEEVIAQFAEEVRKRMHPRDVAGRFEGTAIMVLLERGNERDAEVWGQQLVDHMEAQEFRIGEQPVTLTCTVGVCSVSGMYSSLEELISAVVAAHGVGKKNGGNCVFLGESTDADTRMQRFDAIWVKRIRAAFKENRFRLAQLPIAGLRNDSVQMYDMLIRMIDEQGNPIVPTEFLPAAERNNLMKTIDRWIFSAALEYCAENSVDRAFVRLSRHSMLDTSLVAWMQKELNKRKVDPASIAVQFPEQDAARYIKYIRKTVQDMQKLGVQFALEHYGVDQNRIRILDILKPNYIKIDGELMHALMTDTDMQDRVRAVAEAAEQRNIETIAERVENANAMAVLFQVGVHYMQGHYVHEPEVVLQEPVNVATTTLEAIANN